jgi:predicted amidophosphoribosyltransferase
MNERLSVIGPREREQHYYLKPEHRCYFWGEYTAWDYTHGQNAEFSETNRLVADLKVPVDKQDGAEWERKLEAIEQVSRGFAGFWRWHDLANKALLVPMPPSKSAADHLHDDRMLRIVEGIIAKTNAPLSCKELLVSDGSLAASHQATTRPKLKDLVKSLSIDPTELPTTSPKMIFLFDDVLTTGAHFVACSTHIRRAFPQARIIGNFVARTRRPDPDER